MISNQILQDTVTGIKSITRVELCVMDTEGKILATTMRGKVAISKSHPTAVNNIPKFIQNHTATVIYINQFIQKRTLCE